METPPELLRWPFVLLVLPPNRASKNAAADRARIVYEMIATATRACCEAAGLGVVVVVGLYYCGRKKSCITLDG